MTRKLILFVFLSICLSQILGSYANALQKSENDLESVEIPRFKLLPFNDLSELGNLAEFDKRNDELKSEATDERDIRSPLGTMRFGKRNPSVLGPMRFGKRSQNPLGTMRFGKRIPLGTMRFGKRVLDYELKKTPLGTMRFGKRNALDY